MDIIFKLTSQAFHTNSLHTKQPQARMSTSVDTVENGNNTFENMSKQLLRNLSSMTAFTPTIIHWYIQSENLNNLYNFESKTDPDIITQFEQNLSPIIFQLSSIMLKQYLSISRKPYIVNFLTRLTYRCRTISSSAWLNKKLLLLFYNELKQNSENKHAVLLIFANIAVIIHCYNDYKTKQLLMDNNFFNVIYDDFQKMNKENNGKFKGNEISFTSYILGWSSSDSNNKYLNSMLMDKDLNALDMILNELQCALNNEHVEYKAVSFVPAVWNRCAFINILMDNKEYQQILMGKNILLYLSKALKFEEKQKRDTIVLRNECCNALWKLCKNDTREMHLEFLKYQDSDDHNLWTSLQTAKVNDDTNIEIVKNINDCMRNYYLNVTNTMNNLSIDCYQEIVSFIW